MSAEIKILIDSVVNGGGQTITHLNAIHKKLIDINKTQVQMAKDTPELYAKQVTQMKAVQIESEKVKQAIDKQTIAQEKLFQEQQKTIQQQEKSAQAKSKSAIEALKLADAEKKSADAAQRAADKAKRQNDAYGLLSKRHQELKREAMNLAAAYGVESKQAQAAAAAANKLDVQLKTIDAKMGDHRRNVGNYASAWSGLNNVLGQFGIALSVGAVFQGMKATIHSFVEAEKNAHQLEFAIKNVGDEGEAAFQKLIAQSEKLQATGGVFSDDEIQQAQTQLVNYGLLSDEVEVLMPKILDLATAQGVDLATATDTVIKGINGQTRGLKTVGLGFDDTGSRAENYSIILDKLTKFEGEAAAAATTTEGKYLVLMNRWDDLKEDMGEWLITGGSAFLEYWDMLSAKLDGVDAEFADLNQRMAGTTTKIVEDRLAAMDEAGFSVGMKIVELQRISEAEYKRSQELRENRTKAIAEGKDLSDAQEQRFSEEITYITQSREAIAREIAKLEASRSTPEGFEERTGDADDDGAGGSTKDKKKKAAKSAREIEYERYRARVKARNEIEIADRQREFDEEQKRLADIEARRKEDEEIIEAQEELAHWQWKQKKEQDKLIEEENKRHQEEMISQIEEFGNKVNDARLEQSERNLSLIEKEIKDQEDMVDLQRQRAIRGQENTLAFEEKRKADLERAAIAEQKRQEKIKKQDAYWSLVAAFAKSDGDEAAQKAALEIAEGIAISAAFAEKGGMGEDLKDTTTLSADGWSKTHGSGDVLTMISPKEGILTEQNIAALGGKDAFYDLKWNLENMAKNPIPDDVFEKQNDAFMNVSLRKVETIDTRPIEDKLDRVVDAISKIEVHKHDVDKFGNYLLTVQKQNSKIVTDKGRFVKPQRNKFIS